MKLVINITEEMKGKLDAEAKKRFVSPGDVAKIALTEFILRSSGVSLTKRFGLSLGDFGRILYVFGETLIDHAEGEQKGVKQ